MSAETITLDPVEEIAEKLLNQLLHEPEQLKLFEPDPYAHFDVEHYEAVRRRNPGKLVCRAALVEEYRYKAAMYGAGFHPSQFEDISWVDTGESGMSVDVGFLGEVYIRRVAEKRFQHNKMWDEVQDEMFTAHVPTTEYSSRVHGVFITSEEDLKRIFVFDQNNLGACRSLSMDLLYERED
jgi:hypothetical protein